jgi:hypothetical protein
LANSTATGTSIPSYALGRFTVTEFLADQRQDVAVSSA